MHKREQLPARRIGYNQTSIVGGEKIHLRTGEYPDGRLGEIFVSLNKDGSFLRLMMNCFCIAVSLGLQYGVPLEAFVEKFSGQRGKPSGVVIGHPHIKMASSLLDFIFRDLAIHYLGRNDMANVPVNTDD